MAHLAVIDICGLGGFQSRSSATAIRRKPSPGFYRINCAYAAYVEETARASLAPPSPIGAKH